MRSVKDLNQETLEMARQWPTSATYIPVNFCEHRRLYLVQCRNFVLGVYNETNKSFYGLRFKFGRLFIDTEDHWDKGEPYGTARPLEALQETLPEKILFDRSSDQLFLWLEGRRRHEP